MYVFILSIVALISVSVLSNAMFVRRGIATPFTVALKFVPILFLAAGGIFIFATACLLAVLPEFISFLAFAMPFLVGVIAVAYIKFAEEKFGFKWIVSAMYFFWVLAASAFIVLGVPAIGCLYACSTWKPVALPVEPKCFLELKRLPTLCPEFERRISFKSGKKVKISTDTCGLGEFELFNLCGGCLYMKNTASAFSYVIDSESERVCEFYGDWCGNFSEISSADGDGKKMPFPEPDLEGKEYLGRLKYWKLFKAGARD